MTIPDDIDQYIEHFRSQNEQIDRVGHPVFRKILYLVEIDTLSRAAFATVQGHRKRFLRFIDRCSNWSDKDRVSAVQLKLLLEENHIRSGSLYDRVESCIASWGYFSIIRPAGDLTFTEAEKLASSNERRSVNDSRYSELLYTYRNHLVHEFRQPGYGMEISDDPTTPYYHGMEESPWELVFPGKFLHKLCESCIDGLKAYLKANNLNPYDSYQFGTMWRRS